MAGSTAGQDAGPRGVDASGTGQQGGDRSGGKPGGRTGGRPSGGRERLLDAARELFVEHGVSGTSLQMIADRLGVTKAAVYYHFRAKRDIELALLQPVMTYLEGLAERGEAATPDERCGLLVAGIVDLFIAERQTFGGLQRDPELSQVVAEDEAWAALIARVGELLLGPEPDLEARTASTMLGAGLAAVVLEPTLADRPEAELRAAMLAVSARLLS